MPAMRNRPVRTQLPFCVGVLVKDRPQLFARYVTPLKSPGQLQVVARDLAVEAGAGDGHEEVAVGDGEVEGGAALEAGDEAREQLAVDRVELESFGAVDALAGELAQEDRG